MPANYIDLVLVKYPLTEAPLIAQAPRFSHIPEDMKVELDDGRVCKVMQSCTVEVERDEFNFIIALYGANRTIPKIVKRYIECDYEYTDEETNAISGKE